MEHVIILFYLLSFTLGFSVILIVFLLWLKNRSQMLKMFLLCAVSLTLILMEQMITAYALANTTASGTMETVLRFVSAAGCSLLIYSLTRLVRMLLGRLDSAKFLTVLTAYALVPVAATAVYSFIHTPVVLWVASALFFFSILYNTITLLIHLNLVHMDIIRGGIRNLIIIALLLFPLMIADLFIERITVLGDAFTFGLFSVFVFYSIFSGMSLFYIVKGFSLLLSRAKQPNNSGRTGQDLSAYHITNREKEIISFLIAGLSYGQIAQQLTISLPTVKTHVTNIYKKIGVRNKIELMNAVKSEQITSN